LRWGCCGRNSRARSGARSGGVRHSAVLVFMEPIFSGDLRLRMGAAVRSCALAERDPDLAHRLHRLADGDLGGRLDAPPRWFSPPRPADQTGSHRGLSKTTCGAPEHILGVHGDNQVKYGIEIPHPLSILACHGWNAKVEGRQAPTGLTAAGQPHAVLVSDHARDRDATGTGLALLPRRLSRRTLWTREMSVTRGKPVSSPLRSV
jgi:hypothetical protein